MTQAELLIAAQTVPAGDTGSSHDAQSSTGATRGPGASRGDAATVEHQLSRLEMRLLAEAGGDPAVEQHVRRLLSAAHARFAGAAVRRFLPILIERDVRRQLPRR